MKANIWLSVFQLVRRFVLLLSVSRPLHFLFCRMQRLVAIAIGFGWRLNPNVQMVIYRGPKQKLDYNPGHSDLDFLIVVDPNSVLTPQCSLWRKASRLQAILPVVGETDFVTMDAIETRVKHGFIPTSSKKRFEIMYERNPGSLSEAARSRVKAHPENVHERSHVRNLLARYEFFFNRYYFLCNLPESDQFARGKFLHAAKKQVDETIIDKDSTANTYLAVANHFDAYLATLDCGEEIESSPMNAPDEDELRGAVRRAFADIPKESYAVFSIKPQSDRQKSLPVVLLHNKEDRSTNCEILFSALSLYNLFLSQSDRKYSYNVFRWPLEDNVPLVLTETQWRVWQYMHPLLASDFWSGNTWIEGTMPRRLVVGRESLISYARVMLVVWQTSVFEWPTYPKSKLCYVASRMHSEYSRLVGIISDQTADSDTYTPHNFSDLSTEEVVKTAMRELHGLERILDGFPIGSYYYE